MAKSERFEKVYTQGKVTVMEIWVDKETGVNYVFHASGYSGGMTKDYIAGDSLTEAAVMRKRRPRVFWQELTQLCRFLERMK